MIYMKLTRLFSVLMFVSFLVSCEEDSKLEKEISNVEVQFDIERFDKVYANADSKDLPNLKKTFPFLFSKHIPDSVWVQRMQDTLQQELSQEVSAKFQDLKNSKADLQNLFQHLKYYDQSFSIPRVVTLTNYVDYRNKTIVTDSIVLIALDNFLGGEHRFYQSIPQYLSENMRDDLIVVNVAEQYAKKYIFQPKRQTFLDEMIYFGKLHYFKDIMIPFKSDASKIEYTEEELKWAEANESAIWSYFIEKELLYSTDSKLPGRFIANAPFSKFYLELDNESPGRLGQYIGWQIVKTYAKRTGDNVFDIMKMQPEELFRKSNFKPKK